MSRIHLLNPAAEPESVDGPGSLLCPPFGSGLITRRFRCDREEPRPGDPDVLMLQSAYCSVREHLAADTSREHGGLLLGLELPAPGGGTSVLVAHALPAQFSHGDPVRLTFTEETWAEFNRVTDEYEKSGLRLRRLGWYHSHPGIAIFLSSYDLDVCTLFTRSSHVALVVDPIGDRGGFFVHGAEGYRPQSPQGFVEVCDERPETVVTWSNVTEIEASQARPETTLPERNGTPTQPEKSANEESTTTTGGTPRWRTWAWSILTAAALLVAVIGWNRSVSLSVEARNERARAAGEAAQAERLRSENSRLKRQAEKQEAKARDARQQADREQAAGAKREAQVRATRDRLQQIQKQIDEVRDILNTPASGRE